MENMEVIEKEGIKNKSEFTNKEVINGLSFLTGKNKKIMTVLLFFGIVFTGLGIAKLDIFKEINHMLLFCGITVIFMALLVLIIIPLIMKKNNNNFNDGVVFSYEFFDDEFKVESVLTGQISSTVVKYNSLFKSELKDNYVYIFISKAQCYLLKLDGFNCEEDKNKVLDLLNVNKK